MVERIYKMKNQLLQQAEKELDERGLDRIDVNRMGEMVDMIKDLAEAEASCWQAEYYKTVTKAMEQGSSGYGGGTGSSAGYGSSMQMSGGRSGYATQSSMYDTARQGYMDGRGGKEVVESLRKEIQSAGPDDRERIRHEVMSVIGAM